MLTGINKTPILWIFKRCCPPTTFSPRFNNINSKPTFGKRCGSRKSGKPAANYNNPPMIIRIINLSVGVCILSHEIPASTL
jgi:hypothetical protein